MRQTSRTGAVYVSGDWNLPKWWTDHAPIRTGYKPTLAETVKFFEGPFVRDVLGHSGGITRLPRGEQK